ncbi:MAG: hypothetical protein ACKOAD_05685, partial [Gammaproteobacteria bacterium]
NKPVLKNEIFYIKMLGINIRRGASPPSEPLPEQAVTDGALRRISVESTPGLGTKFTISLPKYS